MTESNESNNESNEERRKKAMWLENEEEVSEIYQSIK